MTAPRRYAILGGVILATFSSSGAALAHALGWRVIAEGRTPANVSRSAVVHAKILHPHDIAVRVVSRRNGRYLRGEVTAMVSCGGWRRVQTFIAQTPFVRRLRHQAYASRCLVDASAMAVNQNAATANKVQILVR